jgi:hypothetical protein
MAGLTDRYRQIKEAARVAGIAASVKAAAELRGDRKPKEHLDTYTARFTINGTETVLHGRLGRIYDGVFNKVYAEFQVDAPGICRQCARERTRRNTERRLKKKKKPSQGHFTDKSLNE